MTLAGWLALAGCSTPTDTQPYDGLCTPLYALDWTPSSGAQDVPRDTIVRVQFSDYPDPDTVNYAGLVVRTGPYRWNGTVRLDLVDKVVSYESSGLFYAQLGYTIDLLGGLRSLQGCAAHPDTHTFRTALEVPAAAPPPVPPTPYALVQPILATRCAGAACHRATVADGGGCLVAPAMNLSLCDADAVDALLDVPSRQVTRLMLVEPHDSTRSYLLRKLLPGATPDLPAPTTLGHRDPPGAPLSDAELHTIASWIDTGLAR